MAKNVSGEGLKPHKWQGRWRGGLTIGFDTAGKQKIKYYYGKTQTECQFKINEAKKQRDEGTLRTERSMSVKEWVDHWLEVKKTEVTERTLEEYEYNSRHLMPRIGKVKIDKLTALQVQKAQLDIREAVSARQAVQSRGLLFNAMSDALKLGLVPRNVVALVDPVKYETQEFQIWSAPEIVRFLQFAQRGDYYPLFYTALTTGMRPGELIALHWEDVDGDKLFVRRTVSVVNNKPVLKQHTKTKHGKRVLTIPDDTAELLESRRALSDEGPLVFPSRKGNFLGHGNLLRSLELYARKAEITVIRTHDLRHTYASMRIADGVDIMTLSRDLGHANPSFTLNRYGHIFDRHRKRDAPSLNRLLGLSNGIDSGTAPLAEDGKE
jgi:integrase